MKKRALVIMLLCLAASAGAQELLDTVKAGYAHLDWLGPGSWIRTVVP